MIWLFVALFASIALPAALVTFAYFAFSKPDTPPLAVLDLRSGRPFELHFVSNGGPMRVWIDMQCDACAYPLEGSMRATAGGRTIASGTIQAGDVHDSAFGGHSRSFVDHLVFEAPARPPGTEITLTGTLSVRRARDDFGRPIRGAGEPRMRLFRLTVTD